MDTNTVLAAYREARSRTAAAAMVEQAALHAAARALREAGQDLTEAAATLAVPRAAVHDVLAGRPLPARRWVTEGAYLDAHNAVWAHRGAALDACPFSVEYREDGAMVVEVRA